MEKQFRKAGDSMACRHSVYDTDNHFVINPITRMITSKCRKTELMRHDHNSERFTFEVPRYIEGHDMSLCDKIFVRFSNDSTDGLDFSNGVYPVVDMQISPDGDDTVIFSWLISGDATKYAGILSFGICFLCTTNSVVDYAWHTDTFNDIKINEGVHNINLF